jgi:Lipocalin-like domain
MNWRGVVVASVMAALTYSVLTGAGAQQQKGKGGEGKAGAAPAAPANTGPFDGRPLKEAIVGSWRLLIVDTVKPDGTQIPNYGPNPRGMIMFGPEGRYSSQIMRDIGRPNFAGNDRLKGTPDEIKAAFDGMISHFGTYTVDEQSKALTFRIEASSFPNWTDTKQTRIITALWQDDFVFTNATPSTQTFGGDKTMLAWRRIK